MTQSGHRLSFAPIVDRIDADQRWRRSAGCAGSAKIYCSNGRSVPGDQSLSCDCGSVQIKSDPRRICSAENPAHQPIYEQLKQVRALERLQTLLSPFRLPHPLFLKVSGCDGVSNAWYDEGFVTVCYEFLTDILKNALEKTLPSVITQDDAILGPFMDVFLHETGHAVFDQLKVPVLGREEDAADLFSVYIVLQMGKEDARRLILGNAYQYKEDVVNPQVPLTKYSDEHGISRSDFSTCCALRMALTKNYLQTLWRKDTCQNSERKAVTANTIRLLSRSTR